MALGAEDVQPAEAHDFLVLRLGLAPEVREDPLPVAARDAVEGVDVEEVDELLVVHELFLALGQLLGDAFAQRLLACHVLGIAAEQDVGAAARHVRGDGDVALAAGLGDDFRFLRVVLRVEDDVLDAAPAQQRGELLGLLDRHRADQRRPAGFLLLDDVLDDGLVLLPGGAVDAVGLLDALQRPVGRRDHDVQLVNLVELRGFRLGRAGHPGQLLVLAEVVLEGDGGERLVLALDLHLFLGFHRLVQAVAPAPSRHQPAGELVHDHDAAVLDHVIDVEPEQVVRAQRLVDMVEERHVRRVVEAVRPRHEPMRELLLHLRHAGLGQRDGLVLLVDDEVAGRLELLALLGLDVALRHRARLQPRDDAIDLVVEVGRFLGRARR